MKNQEVKSNTEQGLYHVWYKAMHSNVTYRCSQDQQTYRHYFQGSTAELQTIRAYCVFIFEANIRAGPKTKRCCTGQSNQHCPLTRIKKENDDTDVCTCMVKEKLCKPCFYCSDHMPNIEFSPAANIKKDNSIVPKMPIK